MREAREERRGKSRAEKTQRMESNTGFVMNSEQSTRKTRRGRDGVGGGRDRGIYESRVYKFEK